jgi:5-methylcytosine-specific restriction enzyme subunit McrC
VIPVENIYYLLCYAWNVLPERGIINVGTEQSPSLLNLFASILTTHTARQLKRGLPKRYREHKETFPGIRGRLLVQETIREHYPRSGKASCQYDDLTINHPFNQLLKTTLRRIAVTDGITADLRQASNRLAQRFEQVDEIRPLKTHVGLETSQIRDGSQRLLLHVCQLLHENLLVNEQTGRFTFQEFWKDEKQMAALFEDFVRNFYRIEQTNFSVRRETIHWQFIASEADRQMLPRMLTDITLENADRKLIIDAKFYEETFQRHFNVEKIHSTHLYQLFAYIKNQTPTQKEIEGILLYPVVKQSVSARYKNEGNHLRVTTVNLAQPWPKIHHELLQLIT